MAINGKTFIGAALAGLAAVLVACGGNGPGPLTPPTRSNAAIRTTAADTGPSSFPGSSAYGVCAHYVIFVQPNAGAKATLEVISWQAAAYYEKAFPASKRAAGATIRYPDGSTQATNGTGEFDAGLSSYAKAHPEGFNGKDVVVTIDPPAGTNVASVAATIFAPSESLERKIESGVIPPDAKPSVAPSPGIRHPRGYIWSCNPKDYVDKGFTANPYRSYETYVTTNKGAWWAQHFYQCGTDQPSTAVAWSSISWFNAGDADRWFIKYQMHVGHKGEKTALWLSPSNYDFGRSNIHLMLIEST